MIRGAVTILAAGLKARAPETQSGRSTRCVRGRGRVLSPLKQSPAARSAPGEMAQPRREVGWLHGSALQSRGERRLPPCPEDGEMMLAVVTCRRELASFKGKK